MRHTGILNRREPAVLVGFNNKLGKVVSLPIVKLSDIERKFLIGLITKHYNDRVLIDAMMKTTLQNGQVALEYFKTKLENTDIYEVGIYSKEQCVEWLKAPTYYYATPPEGQFFNDLSASLEKNGIETSVLTESLGELTGHSPLTANTASGYMGARDDSMDIVDQDNPSATVIPRNVDLNKPLQSRVTPEQALEAAKSLLKQVPGAKSQFNITEEIEDMKLEMVSGNQMSKSEIASLSAVIGKIEKRMDDQDKSLRSIARAMKKMGADNVETPPTAKQREKAEQNSAG